MFLLFSFAANNISLIESRCSFTYVVLTRDENTGLITSYREYWDQSVNDVLKTAKFGKKA